MQGSSDSTLVILNEYYCGAANRSPEDLDHAVAGVNQNIAIPHGYKQNIKEILERAIIFTELERAIFF